MKHLDCVSLAGLPEVPGETTEEYLPELVGLGLDVRGEGTEWLPCGLGKKEEPEVALIVLSGEVCESILVSVFEVED